MRISPGDAHRKPDTNSELSVLMLLLLALLPNRQLPRAARTDRCVARLHHVWRKCAPLENERCCNGRLTATATQEMLPCLQGDAAMTAKKYCHDCKEILSWLLHYRVNATVAVPPRAPEAPLVAQQCISRVSATVGRPPLAPEAPVGTVRWCPCSVLANSSCTLVQNFENLLN